MKTAMTHILGTRVSKTLYRDFVRKANKIPGANASIVLRDLASAFVANRITIHKLPKGETE